MFCGYRYQGIYSSDISVTNRNGTVVLGLVRNIHSVCFSLLLGPLSKLIGRPALLKHSNGLDRSQNLAVPDRLTHQTD